MRQEAARPRLVFGSTPEFTDPERRDRTAGRLSFSLRPVAPPSPIARANSSIRINLRRPSRQPAANRRRTSARRGGAPQSAF
jgi:hypothetical protein